LTGTSPLNRFAKNQRDTEPELSITDFVTEEELRDFVERLNEITGRTFTITADQRLDFA